MRALRAVPETFTFLVTAFHSLPLAYTATSPRFRHSPRASAAPGLTVHPRSSRQNVGPLSMDKLHWSHWTGRAPKTLVT